MWPSGLGAGIVIPKNQRPQHVNSQMVCVCLRPVGIFNKCHVQSFTVSPISNAVIVIIIINRASQCTRFGDVSETKNTERYK